jgi:L-histidine N-alpha-methyltransferase
MTDLPAAARARAESEFARAVRAGLSKEGQKGLPSRYFYDDIGSGLFDVITLLPEYGLTRADARLLKRHAREIVRRAGSPLAIAELGSGSGSKTRWVLQALARREPVTYYPIDVSCKALAGCARELADFGTIVPLEASYLDGLRQVVSRRVDGQRLLLLFLGSTIGNFERPAILPFLSELRQTLRRGDSLLLGADLVKPVPQMLRAYDDPTGVTAAFNLNLLARINRELGADFDLRHFEHLARYSANERRIEMHLKSTRRQQVTVRDAGFTCEFAAGETIWTEACHKFRAEEIVAWGAEAGFVCDAQWTDPEWPFVETLLLAE